ncbi:MAG: flagellar hook-associated protein 3 [Candidatus Hydrogenedens sp.]|nr:flagellar hook-associated protein 3 [Candidatus Hydrogenedens sp.]
MGAIRVTQRILVDRVLTNLNRQSRNILDLQEQLATGFKVNRPSDDPLAIRRAVSAKIEVGKNDQYLSNISSAGPQLLETETSILTVVDVIQRVKELSLQANNTTNGQDQLDQIANEVNQLLEQLLVQGNTVTNDRYVFAGTRTQTQPFVAARDANGDITAVTYAGNDDTFNVEISEGITVPANLPGSDVFLSTSADTVDVYQLLIDTRDAMRTGNFPGIDSAIDRLDTAQDQMLVQVSRLGALQSRLQRSDTNLRDVSIQLEQVVSDNLDADFAEVALNLNAQSNAFQAALNAGSRVIQASLLDFLR